MPRIHLPTATKAAAVVSLTLSMVTVATTNNAGCADRLSTEPQHRHRRHPDNPSNAVHRPYHRLRHPQQCHLHRVRHKRSSKRNNRNAATAVAVVVPVVVFCSVAGRLPGHPVSKRRLVLPWHCWIWMTTTVFITFPQTRVTMMSTTTAALRHLSCPAALAAP